MKFDEWQNSILTCIRHIADESYQQASWFGKGDVVSSPEEIFCELFDDYMFEDFLASNNPGISIVQKRLGLQLLEELNLYSDSEPEYLNPSKVFNDPAWRGIRKIAKKFIESFT